MARKNIIYSLLLLASIFIVYQYRQSQQPQQLLVAFTGTTMGTTYTVKYLDAQERDLQRAVDSLLVVFNQSLSTYEKNSEINTFNQTTLMRYRLPYFYPVLQKSKDIYEVTQGAFDPTVAPLVNAWGFGPNRGETPDSTQIDSLLSMVGFDSIFFDSVAVCKLKPGIKLDFSAIAKGYGVDVVAQLIASRGIKDYFVEIGGEVVCSGNNDRGTLWTIGVNVPKIDAGATQTFGTVQLNNQGMATSGNYRNYYVRDGKKYAHTISPYTGYPVEHSLLSATVVAPDCMTADAYATAFMVMGIEKAKAIIKQQGLEAFLIYSNDAGDMEAFITDGLKAKVL